MNTACEMKAGKTYPEQAHLHSSRQECPRLMSLCMGHLTNPNPVHSIQRDLCRNTLRKVQNSCHLVLLWSCSTTSHPFVQYNIKTNRIEKKEKKSGEENTVADHLLFRSVDEKNKEKKNQWYHF
jgi:hypothetical protein